MKRIDFSFFILTTIAMNASAVNSLSLSESEIEKLHTYLSTEEENTPLTWKGDPLSIMLPLNSEKRIIFPEPIEANINGTLNSDQLRIINNEQSLYLTALKPFNMARIYVILKNSNKIILLDISTSDKSTNMTRTVKLESFHDSPVIKRNVNLVSLDENTKSIFSGSANHYVNAIRFAWQQMYAPKYLLKNDAEFVRTPMHTQSWISNLVYGDKVLVHPEASWESGELYITVVELRNKYMHTTRIYLEHDLCGEWLAATLYPRNQLKSAGQKLGDSTMLFLLSSKPFIKILEKCHGGT